MDGASAGNYLAIDDARRKGDAAVRRQQDPVELGCITPPDDWIRFPDPVTLNTTSLAVTPPERRILPEFKVMPPLLLTRNWVPAGPFSVKVWPLPRLIPVVLRTLIPPGWAAVMVVVPLMAPIDVPDSAANVAEATMAALFAALRFWPVSTEPVTCGGLPMLTLAPEASSTLPLTSGPADPFKDSVPEAMPTVPVVDPGPFNAISLAPLRAKMAKLPGHAAP